MDSRGNKNNHVNPDPLVIQYKEARLYFNQLNRRKMIEFFNAKGVHDFINSKKFRQFYKSSVKLRSDITIEECPNLLIYNDVSTTNPYKMAGMFNEFFYFLFRG